MIKITYRENRRIIYNSYFLTESEAERFEEETFNAGNSIRRMSGPEIVTIFDLWNDKTIDDATTLELIIKSLYPNEKFADMTEIESRALLAGLIK